MTRDIGNDSAFQTQHHAGLWTTPRCDHKVLLDINFESNNQLVINADSTADPLFAASHPESTGVS